MKESERRGKERKRNLVVLMRKMRGVIERLWVDHKAEVMYVLNG